MKTKNLMWGVGWAALFALGLSLWVSLMYIIFGAEVLDRDGGSFGATVRGYFAGAVAAGLIIGAFRPFLRSRVGACLVGALVGPLTYAGFDMGYAGTDGLVGQLSADSAIVFTLAAMVAGALGGLLLHRQFKKAGLF
ncbi:MAG: hypothetical protein ACOC8B_02920 [Gemmatimonadota bacterium]